MSKPYQPPKLDRWVSMGEAAQMAGEEIRAMRRRLVALNASVGGGVVRRFTENGNYSVNVDALLYHLRANCELRDDQIEVLRGKVSENERRLTALRNSYRRLHRELRRHLGPNGQ